MFKDRAASASPRTWVHSGRYRFRKRLALAGTVLMAITGLCAAAAPAGAATLPPPNKVYIYLTNASSYGMNAQQGVVGGSYVGIASAVNGWGTWWAIPQGTTTEDGVSGMGYEFEAITTSGTLLGWCIGNGDSDNDYAYLTSCGAYGTVWVAVLSGNGYHLFSRYFLDRGSQVVLSVDANPVENGMTVETSFFSGLEPSWYARWSSEDF
jgi:hypothetical protein